MEFIISMWIELLKDQKKSEVFITDNSTLTNGELKLGEDALNEILNEEDLKISHENDINENNTEECSFENTPNNKDGLGLENLKDLDVVILILKLQMI